MNNARPVSWTVSELELTRMARIAHLLDVGKPAFRTGLRPQRSRSGQGTEFLELRDHRPGEDTRHVDWRVSARYNRTFVRTYHDELSSDWQVCLDNSASMHFHKDKLNLATQLANAFTFLLLHVGNRVGLIEFSDHVNNLFPLGRGRSQYVRIAERLRSSLAGSDVKTSLSSITKVLRPGSNLVVLSDFLAPDGMQTDLARLRAPGRKIHAVQILSSHEAQIVSGTRTVEDIETGQLFPVEVNTAENTLHNLQKNLAAYCNNNGIKLTSCSTNDSWQNVIFKHVGVTEK
jgi:uncharacterized protein (DUF58 family)